MTKNDGGPAFPHMVNSGLIAVDEKGSHQIDKEITGGMSLRDWFAGQALCGICAATADGTTFTMYDGTKGGKIEATAAYAWADAMLKAREE